MESRGTHMQSTKVDFPSHEPWSLSLQARVLFGLQSTLRTDDLVLGKAVGLLEDALAKYVGTTHAALVGSGSDAIYLALRAIDVKAGDEIIAPANVCVAVIESILRTNAIIHFADIDRDCYTIDPQAVRNSISPHTRAVLCVHTYGLPANMSQLAAIARENELQVIELCGQAFGATLNGRSVGSFGDVGCYSFNPSKILGGVGDGGAVVTNSAHIAEKVKRLANHGRVRVGADAEYVGISSRLDTFNALVLLHRLRLVEGELRKRRRVARYYRELLSSRLRIQVEPPGYQSSVQFLVAEVSERDRVRESLSEQGVSTKVHYHLPYRMPAYRGCTALEGTDTLPVTEEVAQRILTLPFHNRLRKEEADYVARCLSVALGSTHSAKRRESAEEADAGSEHQLLLSGRGDRGTSGTR